MGLFDFFKSKTKTNTSSSSDEKEQENNNNPLAEDSIQYKTKLIGSAISKSPQQIQEIVKKMVEEDPFQNYYGGKTEEEMTIPSKKYYEYAEISTVNVGLIENGEGSLKILIEGRELGTIPPDTYNDIKQYHNRNMLTAYVFITGGRYKRYSSDTHTVEEGFDPFDLDIFLQYN